MKFHIKRTITGVVGVILGMLIVVGANVPAQATPDTSTTPTWDASVTGPARDASVAAVSPGISPAAFDIRYVGDPFNYSCASGRACFAVWDPTRGLYKVFDLYYCGTYHLSYWYGDGTFRNSQTGGAAVYLYDLDGPIGPFPPASGYYVGNWDPIWRIQPC